jgi:hypothetical protein
VLIGGFLAREREFLQTIAGLIQEHAQTVKDSASRARDEISSVASLAPPSPPGEAPSPHDGGTAAPTPAAVATSAARPVAPDATPPVPPTAPTPGPPQPQRPIASPQAAPDIGSVPGPGAPAGAPAAPEHVHAPLGAAEAAPVRPAPPTILDPAREPPRTPLDSPSTESSNTPGPNQGSATRVGEGGAVGPSPGGSEPEDRSIQELFWGEV